MKYSLRELKQLICYKISKEKETSKEDIRSAQQLGLMNNLWGKDKKSLESFIINWGSSKEEPAKQARDQSIEESKRIWEIYTGKKVEKNNGNTS